MRRLRRRRFTLGRRGFRGGHGGMFGGLLLLKTNKKTQRVQRTRVRHRHLRHLKPRIKRQRVLHPRILHPPIARFHIKAIRRIPKTPRTKQIRYKILRVKIHTPPNEMRDIIAAIKGGFKP